MTITTATATDIPALVILINSAYRGETSKKGWTSEADLLQGELRTDEKVLAQLMQEPDAIFLKYNNEAGEIEGCVFLNKSDNRLYLGMLSVPPMQQAKGIGRQLMNAAEAYCRQQNCQAIFMRVISVRHELISWYEKLGYRKNGQTEPFPTDNRFGIPTQPLEFIILEKQMAAD